MNIKKLARKFAALRRGTLAGAGWLLAGLLGAGAAHANGCSIAASGGSAPATWPSYCWLDFTGYSDATAKSASGQNFSFTLPDGSVLAFNAKVTSTASLALKAVTAPAWSGAAVGNTAFLGITGAPILYTGTSGSTTTVTFSGVTLTPPAGVPASPTYQFVAADGESTNNGESLAFTTNGANWSVLDVVPPTSGSTYPTTSNTGTTFTETGVAGTVGGYIVGSTNATTVSTRLVAGGLQGAMFALQYAETSANSQIAGGRAESTDQFTVQVSATGAGSAIASSTSTGAGAGPFTAAATFIASSRSLTVSETMASGTLANYVTTLTCTNAATGSSTPLPSGVQTTSYTLGSLAYGDVVTCLFTNTRHAPLLAVAKSAPSPALQVGVNSTYTLTVSNTGQTAATTAQVKDQLPANLAFVSATGTNWTCANAAGLLTCNFAGGSIAVGGNSTIAVTVNPAVAASQASLTNYASVDPGGGAAAPAPGASCTPAASCTSVGPNVVAYILPVADSGSGTAGTASTPIANVAANDSVNGVAATLGASGNATVATSGTWPAGISLNTTTGAIAIAATVGPGTYPLVYQLCDKHTPTPDCATVSDTVTVAGAAVPVADSGNATAGVASTPIANVAANDTVNGAAATLGASGNATVATSGTWPAGISLNTTNGAISTTAAVAPGTYSVAYQLCDKVTPTPDCATVTDTITVAASIVPVADSGSAAVGTASTPIANVAANDTINGAPATLGASGNATIATSGTWPAGISLNTATGAISTTAAVAAGTYPVAYQLCDKVTPAPDCATVTDTITVAVSIVPVPQSGTANAGTAAQPVANVASGATINGQPAALGSSGNATVATSGTWPAGITLNPTTGAISTAATVPPGVYPVVVQLCDKHTPTPDCATVTDTITVAASVAPVPQTGTANAGTAAQPVANVASGATINGQPAVLGPSGNATVATSGTWPAGITLNPATGAISTAASVPPGTYPVVVQLCDKATPTPDCTTVTETITVAASIVPLPQAGTANAGTAAQPVANVASGATINGQPAVLGSSGNATVATSGTWPVGITLNPATGAISTAATVPPGSYPVVVQLCDKRTPTPDCTTVTETITVAASIVPVADSGSATAGTASTPIADVAANDTVNGVAATLGASGNATIAASGSWPAGIALNTGTGAVTVGSAVAAGTYHQTYQLCDRITPTPDCATGNVTLVVSPAVVPINQSGTATAGQPATPIANITANDTIAGQPATLGPSGNATVAPAGTWPPGITLNQATGAVSTSASVPVGVYTVSYVLCDRAAPPNCVTASATVTVGLPGAGGVLLITKAADTTAAEIGDAVRYRIVVSNGGSAGVAAVSVTDALPMGFSLIAGTVRIGRDGATPGAAANPAGAPGPVLTWSLGLLGVGESVEIDYRLRVGAGADRGDGTNRAQAHGTGAASLVASAHVTVTGGAFSTAACVAGKIYLDCNGNGMQDADEPGIPGVRLYFEDGTNLTSDENGNYSLCGLRPVTHVLKVDPITLPAGSQLVPLSSRNAGNGASLFVDLRDGELHRVDFAEGSCRASVRQDVAARRQHGPVLAPMAPQAASPAKTAGVDFESEPPDRGSGCAGPPGAPASSAGTCAGGRP